MFPCTSFPAFFVDTDPAPGAQDTFDAVIRVSSRILVDADTQKNDFELDIEPFRFEGCLQVRYTFTQLGACCLPNGTCLDAQTQAACEAATPAGLGGVYQGDDTTCGALPSTACQWACCLPTGDCV
jgi:hypothetical protein